MNSKLSKHVLVSLKKKAVKIEMNHRTPMSEWTLYVLPLRWCSFSLGCLEIGCICFPFYKPPKHRSAEGNMPRGCSKMLIGGGFPSLKLSLHKWRRPLTSSCEYEESKLSSLGWTRAAEDYNWSGEKEGVAEHFLK